MKIMFCYVAWMKNYSGPSKADPAVWGRREWHDGVYAPARGGDYYLGECHLFEPCFDRKGARRLFGDVQGNIDVKRLGGLRENGYADGVTVFWCARNPNTKKTQVVGYYQNARVYGKHQGYVRKRITVGEWRRLSPNLHWDYNIECDAADGVLLPLAKRIDVPEPVTAQSGSWKSSKMFRYPDSSGKVKSVVRRVLAGRPGDHAKSETDSPITYAMRQIKQRQGQGAFRKTLLAAYGRTCAITGCSTEALLDACHILGASEKSATNAVTNGVLLRTDLHTLFDLGLLRIEPSDYRVWISPGLDKAYKVLVGRKLRLPEKLSAYPDKTQLEVRWKQKKVPL